MNKQDIIGAVAAEVDVSRDTAASLIDAFLGHVTSALVRGEEVRLMGFGNFVVAERKASTGRNPRTGEPMDLPASRMPKFRVGRTLKEACNR